MAPPPPPPSRGGDLRGGSASSELQKQHHQGPTSSAVISANSIHHQQHHAYSATSQQSTSSQSLSSPAHLQQPGGINAGPFVPNSSLPTFIKHKIALHQQQAGTNSASSRGPPSAGSSAASGSSASRLRAAAAAASGQHHQPPQHVPHQGLSGANGSSYPNNLAPMASSLAAKLQSLQLTGGISSRGPTGSRCPPPPPIITPPPSYSASRSSSSGPQSPSLVSSSSDYSSVPPFIPNGSTPYVLFQNLRKNSSPSPGSQGPSQSSSLVINGQSASSHGPSQSQYHSSHSSHPHQQHHPMLQPSSSRKAVSQSPIIMQSVKSQKINKPILQTAIGPNHAIKGYASTPSVPGAIGQGQQSSSMSNSQMTTHQTVITTNTHQGPSNVQRGLAPPTPPSPLYISGSSSSNVSFSNIPSPVPSTTSSARSGTSSNQQRNPPPPYSSVHHQLISGVPNGTAATVTPRAPSSCGSSSSARTSPRTVPDTTTPGTSPAYPPPPYSAAIQSVANRTRILDNTPPPPLPPNYPMAALEGMPPAAQQELIAQLMSNMMSANPSPPSLYGGSNGSGSGTSAGPTSSHQVPTTEPPSYASSMAAIAAQRAAAVAVANGTAPGAPAPPAWIAHRPLPAPPPSPPVPSSSSSSTSATTVKSNLVNTVESICNSQISALQATARPTLTRIPAITDSTVPPLPPKPNAAVVNAPPPPLPIISEQLSTTSSSEDPEDTTPPMRSSSPIPPQRRGKLVPESTSSTTISTLKGKPFSPAACKFYMEQHFENLIKSQKQREIRRQQLETEMTKCNLTPEAKCEMRRMLHQKESNYIRLRRAKMDRSMFDKIRTIGVGAFGEVALVRKKDVDVLYAMKTLRKVDVFKRNQVAHVKAERDILAEADNEWVVRLYFSFQDETYLYFVMDYIPGGDLMSLLIKLNIFEEPLAQFYIAELVCAVESVHKMGFIHRDIKPDNVLIDRDGHIKLTDFGLCTGFRWTHNSKYYNTSAHERVNSMDFDLLAGTGSGNNGCNCNGMTTNQQPSKPLERRKHRREHQRCLAHSLVGTPNYIAPEVLMRLGYTQLCDWWSVGVILYEMVVGSPPFYAASAEETQQKVINWRQTLQIPPEARLSSSTRRLITQLCCGPENRLGRNGAEEIKAHPFFASIDFESGLRNQPAPYVPVIEHPTDTSNFDDIDPAMLQHNSDSETSAYDTEYVNEIADQFEISGGPGGTPGALRGQSRKHRKKTLDPSDPKHPQHAFFEFTFRRFFDSSGQAIPIRVNAHGHHHHGGEVSEAAEDNESMLYGSVTDGSTTATSTTTGSQVSSGADLYGAFEGGVGQEGLNSNPHQTEIDSGIPKRAGSGSSSTLTNGGSGGSSGGAGAPKNGTIPIISAVTS